MGVHAGSMVACGASKLGEEAAMLLKQLSTVGPIALIVTLAPVMPAVAVTAKEKMETCKFGADDQKLAGAARKKFLSRCMASADAPAKRSKTPPEK
jgi:hypothetical protein